MNLEYILQAHGLISGSAKQQDQPPAPTVTNIKWDSATATGIVGSEVSLDNLQWYISPHTFTSLNGSTIYNAYARMPGTEEILVSPISVAKTFTTPIEPDDKTGSPGSANSSLLVIWTAGYLFGVSASK